MEDFLRARWPGYSRAALESDNGHIDWKFGEMQAEHITQPTLAFSVETVRRCIHVSAKPTGRHQPSSCLTLPRRASRLASRRGAVLVPLSRSRREAIRTNLWAVPTGMVVLIVDGQTIQFATGDFA